MISVIHHDDLDGICSAAIFRYHSNFDKKVKYYKANYLFDFKNLEINKDDLIIILDYGFNEDQMNEIISKTENLVWIDHHKTRKNYKLTKEPIGLRDFSNKKAACELTWQYFQGSLIPPGVAMLGDFDTWSFKYGDVTKAYQIGLASRDPQVCSDDTWTSIFQNVYGYDARIIEDGKICLAYRDQFCKNYQSYGFEAEFEGYKCYCINLYRLGSFAVADNIEKYPICIAFVFNGEQWEVSLYSKEIDVSKIAIKYGGGGHKSASGYICKELPFKKCLSR